MSEVFEIVTNLPIFGIALCIFTFWFGVALQKRTSVPIANPLLISTVLCIAFLLQFNIPYERFKKGADVINMFLAPVTAVLALAMYHQRAALLKNMLPALIGTAVGSLACVLSVFALTKLFGLEKVMTDSLFSKSVTTPIALAITEQRSGIISLTVAGIMITGLIGAIFSPLLIKIFHVKNRIAAGLAIGTSSHALGTTRALQIGELEGAMSSIAIGLAGLATVIIALFL